MPRKKKKPQKLHEHQFHKYHIVIFLVASFILGTTFGFSVGSEEMKYYFARSTPTVNQYIAAQAFGTAAEEDRLSPEVMQMLMQLLQRAGLSDHAHSATNAHGNTSTLPQDEPYVEISEDGEFRTIVTNGIPDHSTGDFPNSNNPNRISAQHTTYVMTLTPERASTITELGLYPFAVGLNGVPFDPSAAEYWNNDRTSGWQYEALAATSNSPNLGLDDYNAHVQPTGTYHYHGLPSSTDNDEHSPLLGYAADGFPLYGPYVYSDAADASSSIIEVTSSYRIQDGERPSGPGGAYDGTFVQDYAYVAGSGELGECNVRFGVTPEYPDGTYYYVVTNDFPFIPRCFIGTPHDSFMRTTKQHQRGSVGIPSDPMMQQKNGDLFGFPPPPVDGQQPPRRRRY